MCDNKRFHIKDLIEGVDFNWEEINGVKLRVFTKEYLLMPPELYYDPHFHCLY